MYFTTEAGHPVKSNCPDKSWKAVDKKEYDRICAEKNAEAEAERIATEEAARPEQEKEKLIQDKMREIAIKELEKEGKI